MSEDTKDKAITAAIILAATLVIVILSVDSISIRFGSTPIDNNQPIKEQKTMDTKLEAIHQEMDRFCGFKITGITDVEWLIPPEVHETHYDIVLQLVDKKSNQPVKGHLIHSRWREHLNEVIKQEKFANSLMSYETFNKKDSERDAQVIYIWTDVSGNEMLIESSLDVLERWGARALNALVEAANKAYFKAQSQADRDALKAFQERATAVSFEE